MSKKIIGLLFAVFLVSNTLYAISISDSLVAYWALDETSGTVVYDSSGSNINATNLNNTTIGVAGKFGTAYQFDGIDDHVLGSTAPIVLGAGLTLSGWFKSPGGGEGWPRIVEISDANGGSSQSSALAYDPNGLLRTWTNDENDNSRDGTIDYSTVLYTDNLWHYAVYTYDGSAGKLYVDGVLKQTGTNGGTSNITDIETFVIGCYYPNTDNTFKGAIDDVAIWSRALSSDEISALYLNGLTDLLNIPEPHIIISMLLGILLFFVKK